MRRLVAYLWDMGKAGLSHEDVEQLIRGTGPANETEPDLAELLTAIRATSPDPVTRPGFTSTLAQTASGPTVRRSRPRRVLAVGVTAAAIFALAGVAAAADGAYPGHPLHGIDKALEMVGIGNGGPAERLVEVRVLLDKGKLWEAEKQLAELGLGQPAPQAADTASVAGLVGDKKDFIEDNKGDGVGVDGRDFGEGVVERTPGHQLTPPGQEKKQEDTPTEDVVQPSQTEIPSDDTASEPVERSNRAGPSEGTGPPEHAGPSEGTGPPEHAGSKKADNT